MVHGVVGGSVARAELGPRDEPVLHLAVLAQGAAYLHGRAARAKQDAILGGFMSDSLESGNVPIAAHLDTQSVLVDRPLGFFNFYD